MDDDEGTKIAFKVFWHRERVNEEYTLKLAKPNPPTEYKRCLNVSKLNVSSENKHALHIMHNLNHRNILSMKALGKSKVQKAKEVSAFIAGCGRPLYDEYFWSLVVDDYKIIPSVTFQKIVRGTFDGADFLWRNGTYHGNLSWYALLYEESTQTVQLYDFEHEESTSVGQSQWNDFDAMTEMIQFVVHKAAELHGTPSEVIWYEVNALLVKMIMLER